MKLKWKGNHKIRWAIFSERGLCILKYELGRCLLVERLQEAGMSLERLALELRVRHERLDDFIDNKRVMSLKYAISIADSLQCEVRSLYELTPYDDTVSQRMGNDSEHPTK